MTLEQKQLILDNYKTSSYQQLADMVGISKTSLSRWMQNLGLQRRAIRPETIELLEKVRVLHPYHSNRMMAQKLGVSLTRIKTVIRLGQLKRKPGQQPLYRLPNTGRFAANHNPHNAYEEGEVSLFNNKELPRYRIKYKGELRNVHEVIWEKYHGPKKKGMVIRFVDGNYRNLAIDNLDQINKATHMLLNTKVRYETVELYQLAKMVSQLRLKSKQLNTNTL